MQKLKKEKVEKVQKSKITEKIRGERGITLLALILTVVIMIILAAVTINVALGEGGLVDQAKWAAEQTANVAKSEQEQLDDVASQINDIIAGIGTGDTNSTGGEETNSVETNSVDTNSVDANSVEDTNTVETNTIEPEPDPIPDGTITIGEPDWQEDGTANVSITSSESKHIIQYQINGTDEESWQTVQAGVVTGVKHGDTVYVRITDGEEYSNPQNKKIEDLAAPGKANIEVTPEGVLIGENITAKVTHVDNETGVDTKNSKWVLTQSAEEIGTGSDAIAQYTSSFTTNPETITIDSNAEGTYYLHVLTIDKAGNKTETVSSAITISAITGTVTQNGEITWSGGTATLKLATTDSQYKIVYKVNGEESWKEYNGTSITGLNHGDKVKACLTNEGQTTYGPEVNVTIKDTTAPVVTVTAQGSPTTNSITVTAQAVDNETGMKDSLTYTYYIKKSAEGDESYKAPSGAENISNAQYTFTGLTQGTKYDIKVEVNGDKAGNKGTGTLTNQTTATVPGADEGLLTGSITASPVTWDNYKASTTLTTTTNFKIQYQVNGSAEESWSAAANSPVTVSNLDHGNTVYARLTDGTNAGNYAAINILDGTAPTVSVEVGEVTDTTIAVKVNATDKESGLADSNAYKYYINDELEPRETSSSNTYKYEGLTAKTPYNIKVEVVDKGNNTGTGTTSATTEEPPRPDMGDAKPNPGQDGPKYTNTTEIQDDLGNPVVIPGGFHVDKDSGTKVEEGIVIEDDAGNQFVWIPTGEYNVSTSINSSGKLTNNLSRRTFTTIGATEVSGDGVIENYYYGEGDSHSVASGQIEAFKASAESTAKGGKGGFYIGRFELGTGNVIKAGVSPYTNITRNQAKSNIENMYEGNSNVTSELISSYAWDTALNFICQTNVGSGKGYNLAMTTSSQYGNIGTGFRENTGAYAEDNYSNIHDLLGNCSEWTTEYSSISGGPCVNRGGVCGRTHSYAAYRVDSSEGGTYEGMSARAQIYVK